MRGTMRMALALALLSVAVTAAAAFGQSGGGGRSGGEGRGERPFHREKHGGRFGPHLLHRAVHAELKVQTDEGFATVILDQGTVTEVDAASRTLSLKRADDERVTVTASEDTRIAKNHHRASLGDIRVGDLVRVIREKKGDGLVVRSIAARTPRARAPGRTGGDAAPTSLAV